MAADAERKYEEVARKMNMMENDLQKALNRADNSEDKIIEFEMELKIVGDNMKAMEVNVFCNRMPKTNVFSVENVQLGNTLDFEIRFGSLLPQR